MSQDTKLQQLVINKLTTAQYEAALQAGTIDENQLYMTTDSTIIKDITVNGQSAVGNNGTVALGTMATETASNYSTKAVADTLYAGKGLETTITTKVDKTNGVNKLYGTDSSGNQTTYNYSDLDNTVNDVTVGGTSVLNNKTAVLGSMAGQNSTNYYTKTDVYNKTEVDGLVSSVYKPAGSKVFISLPTPSETNLGNVYNVTTSFTTNNKFVEGSGKKYPAGTNVVVVDIGSDLYAWVCVDSTIAPETMIGTFTYTKEIPEIGSSVRTCGRDGNYTDMGTLHRDSETVATSSGFGFTYTYNRDSSNDVSRYLFDVLAGMVDLSGYVPTSRTVNGKALNTNISLTAADVGALPDSTVIPTVNNATLTIQKNGVDVQTFTANASSNVTANITVPTTVAELSDASSYAFPSQSGNSGKFLTTNGSAVSWAAVDALPSQSGNSGKYLTTNGTSASWSSITIPTVNDATLTITQNGVSKGTFTSNASANKTIALTDTTYTAGDYIDITNNAISGKVSTNTDLVISPASQTQYYAWFNSSYNYAVYTPTQTPSVDNSYYDYYNGTLVDASIGSTYPYGYITDVDSNNYSWIRIDNETVLNRDSSKDMMYPLGESSDDYAPSQKAVKTYVDNGLNSKQNTLVSGTNIKTINSTSLLGSGNISITGLPSQASQSGKFLTTNGTSASWGTVDALPSQSGNSGKFLTTNGSAASWGNIIIPYGESTSAADAVQKEVTISEITELKTGQIIIVKPTITSTVADATLKLNGFSAYPMLYGAAAITTSTDSITWAANYPSWFRFDGSNWVFLGHGVDNNTTYSAMSVANGIAGTETTTRVMRADRLKQIIQGTTLTGLSTSTNSAVVATDSITVGIGKLQAQIPTKATTSTTGLVKPDGTTITITNDGTISSVNPLPSQSGNSGKYLTTNGTTASWATITDVEAYTANEIETIWNSVSPTSN